MNFSTGPSQRNLVPSAAILSSAQYVAAGVGFVTTLLAARWLGPEDFGLGAVIMAYPAAVSSLASIKTAAVTQRYVSSFRANHQHPELLAVCKLGFVVDLAVSTLAMGALVAVVLLVGDPPGARGNSELIAIFALALPVGSVVGTSIVVLFAFERFGFVAMLQVMQKVFVLIGVVVALVIRADTAAFVVGTAAGLAATGLIYLAVASVLLKRAVGDYWWRTSWAPLHGLGRELRSLFGWNFLGVTLAGAMTHVPVLILGAIRSPAEAGYFRLASSVAVTADAVEAAMSRVAYSTLAASQADADVRRVARLVVAWSRREALLGLAAVLAAMALLPAFVFVGLGRKYTGMIAGTELLLLGTAVSTSFFFVIPYLYSSGKIRKWVTAYGLYAGTALVASAVLAGRGGFLAVAGVVGVGLAVLNAAIGLPILRRARRATASAGIPVGARSAATPVEHNR
jgi:O-antigen/teichoic acid export membrane protein